jgi:hypothetical protein
VSQQEARTTVKLDEKAHILALINEIWMLVDYIAGSASQALEKVIIASPEQPHVKLTSAELLRIVSSTNMRLLNEGQVQPNDRAFMQIVRDALNVLVSPASGLTVAYTVMVTGPLRRRTASRFTLAEEAYPNLARRGTYHRRLQTLILVLLAIFTGVAVWESAKVALGKALLQNLDMLRSQQEALNAEKLKLDLSLPPPTDAAAKLRALTSAEKVPLSSYSLCDRDRVLVALAKKQNQTDAGNFVEQQFPFYENAEERDICGRDDILRVNLGIVHNELTTYTENWPGMVGGPFSSVRNFLHCGQFSCEDSAIASLTAAQNDVEFRVAPVLLVWGNFILPIIFSFIGSAIFVTLDHYKKIRDSLLQPKNYFLAPVRLALGLVIGACIGLFFSSYGPGPQTTTAAPSALALISSLTLTASGVAFLAGFGVEAVFSLLESLVTRVFTLPVK